MCRAGELASGGKAGLRAVSDAMGSVRSGSSTARLPTGLSCCAGASAAARPATQMDKHALAHVPLLSDVVRLYIGINVQWDGAQVP